MSVEPQLQASLGVFTEMKTKKDRSWNNGILVFGKILKIHHKRYTADVKIFGTHDIISSESSQEGIHSCRIGVGVAGIDEQFQQPYGTVVPLQKNMIVLVAFIGNAKEKPVIIKAFHDITEKIGEENYMNILTSEYPVTSEVEMYRYLNISRIQDFVTIDGVGNIEISSHTKSFFVGTNKEINEETFDYENLSVKNKKTKKTVGVPENHSFPLKFLAVFRDKFLDSATNWLRIIVDASKTSFKLAKIQQMENKLTMLEIDQDGAIKIRRQLDSKSFSKSKNYTEICIESNGELEVSFNGTKSSIIKLTEDGVFIETKNKISLSSDSDISLSSKTSINLDKNVKISGNLDVSKSFTAKSGSINNKTIAVKGDWTSGGNIIL